MSQAVFLSVDDVLEIHCRIIEVFGGDVGLRDRGLLESAVAMPRATFDGTDLHAGWSQKAAAYHYHLCVNHPFVDGNKRVAVANAELFLLLNGQELTASDDEIIKLTLGVASGCLSKAEVVEFFERHTAEA